MSDIVHTVDEREKTLSLYNVTAPQRVADALADYFAVQSVKLRRSQTRDGVPENFAVLHDGEEYVASSSVRELYRAVKDDADALAASSPEDIEVSDILESIDQTVFTSYDKQRMVGASRLIERTAWRHGDGELHAGFQRLSKAQSQWRLYTKLGVSDVETHLYGAPDWDVPPTDIHLHEHDDEEITRTWFVVFDGGDTKRALLAEERAPNEFYGFWTDRASVADAVLERLEHEYPPTRTP